MKLINFMKKLIFPKFHLFFLRKSLYLNIYKLLCVILFCLEYNFIHSQTYTPIDVPSPQAYSFFRYSEFPVNYCTGLPNINIPIYTVKEGSLEVSITLSYHAGTIKPREQPGWVGLGWTLNVGGVITRKVESIPDETDTYGWYYEPKIGKVWDVIGKWDGTPDIFEFNFDGHTGQFVIDQYNHFHVLPYENIKVELITDDNDAINDIHLNDGVDYLKDYFHPNVTTEINYFVGFKITDGNGNIYEFRQIEYSFPLGADSYSSGGVPVFGDQRINTWYLTRIVSANGYDEINFTYQTPEANKFHLINDPIVNGVVYNTGNPDYYINEASYYSTCLNELVYLEKINTTRSNQIVDFSLVSKNDLAYPYQAGDFNEFSNCNYLGQKIDNIKISFGDNTVKRFKFNYYENLNEKLKLKSIQEYSPELSPASPPYEFTYSDRRMSYDSHIDHWGFYNGDNGIFGVSKDDLENLNGRRPFYDSYKNTNYPDLLKKITYPSGGYTLFEWEQNTFSKVASDPDHILKQFKQTLFQRSANEYYDPDLIDLAITSTDPYAKLFTTVYFNVPVYEQSGCYCGNSGQCTTTAHMNEYSNPGIDQLITDNLATVFDSQKSLCVNKESSSQSLTGRNSYYFGDFSNDYRFDGPITYAKVLTNEYIPSDYEYTGGMRIKKITTSDGGYNPDMIREFEYALEDGNNSSSGVISTYPKTRLTQNCRVYEVTKLRQGGFYDDYPATVIYDSDKNIAPISFSDGSHVNYSRVVEKMSNGSRSVYTFTTFSDFPDTYSSQDPREIFIDNSNFRARIIREENYEGGKFIPVNTKIYSYLKRDLIKDYEFVGIWGVSWKRLKPFIIYYNDFYKFGYFYTKLDYSHIVNDCVLGSVIEITDGVTKTTNFTYDDEYINMPKTISTINSNQTIDDYLIYPFNYNVNSGFIKEMKDKNILNNPIEKFTIINNTVSEGNITTYKTGADIGLRDVLYNLEVDDPLIPPFYPSKTSSGDYSPSSHYKPHTFFDKYDNGNLLQYHNGNGINNDINISYLWGYNNTYPVVSGKNITNSALSAAVNTAKTAAGITDFDQITLPSVNSSERTKWYTFNTNLRNTLPNAMIRTFTYKPLIGITSETDENGKTTYYEYDSLGRLQYIKDQDLNIIKEYNYNYKQD